MEEGKDIDKSIREFDSTEINEICGYVLNNIEYCKLGRGNILLFNIDNLKTIEVFLLSYRIIASVRNLVSQNTTRDKLNLVLKNADYTYNELDRLYKIYLAGSFNENDVLNKIGDLIKKDREKIFRMIDMISAFSRKQSLIDINKFTGIRRDTIEGETLYKRMRKEIDEAL